MKYPNLHYNYLHRLSYHRNRHSHHVDTYRRREHVVNNTDAYTGIGDPVFTSHFIPLVQRNLQINYLT